MTRRVLTALSLFVLFAFGVTSDAGARLLHPESHLQHGASLSKAGHKAKKKTKKSSAPTVSGVFPMTAKVGDKLTISGKGFLPGAKKTTVYFLRKGGGVAITKAESATKSQLVVTIPDSVTGLLNNVGTTSVATRFQIRILAKRYGSATKSSRSPVISPNSSSTPSNGGGPGGTPTVAGCVPDSTPGSTKDSDADGITDVTELTVTHTDPCNADSDGDGVPDGYEYQSALDLNNTTPFGVPDAALPYPGKKPWPNPLDPTDANTDYDGDGLTMLDEYTLNKYVGGPKVGALQYSDGKQRSVDVPAPSDPVLDYMDLVKYPTHNFQWLSDDERDADQDGLGNWDERYGRMTQAWWDSTFSGANGFPLETRYPLTFAGTSMVDPDTNGNGVLDGADDQDHDGLSNAFEISRPWDWKYTYVSNTHSGPAPQDYQDWSGAGDPGPLSPGVTANPWARVQPFNPCKPLYSKTCHLHPDFGYYGQGEDWVGPDPATVGPQPAAPWLFDPNDVHQSGGE